MSSSLRLGLLLASLLACGLVIFLVKTKRLSIKYSTVWFIWSLLSLFMAIFPQSFYSLSKMLGIALPVNAVFLIMIGLLYGLTLFSYIMISKHNEQIIQLTYEIAELKKEIEELKKNNER